MLTKSRTHNKGFGVRRGVVSWDTSQEFEREYQVRCFLTTSFRSEEGYDATKEYEWTFDTE